jgi:hypothetical protein
MSSEPDAIRNSQSSLVGSERKRFDYEGMGAEQKRFAALHDIFDDNLQDPEAYVAAARVLLDEQPLFTLLAKGSEPDVVKTLVTAVCGLNDDGMRSTLAALLRETFHLVGEARKAGATDFAGLGYEAANVLVAGEDALSGP